MDVALEAKHVTKEYPSDTGTITAVGDVSLQIAAGEFVALVGPSGSGKTTLLAMLAGLLRPNAGQIIIAGRDLSAMKEAERTRFRRESIGFTFQSNNLVPYLSVRENVELMLQLNRKASTQGRARATNLLERLGLGQRLHNLPGQLSGGQQQRVAIARSLIHDPAIVLADEPTASLDTERAFQVVETFAELIHEEGRAGVMVTHDLRMCLHVDRVIHMTDGVVDRIYTQRDEIAALARGESRHNAAVPPQAAA